MKQIKDLFARFKNLTPPNDALRRAVAEAVVSVVGVPLTRELVAISRGTAFLKCSSIAKSAIRARRAEILTEVARRVPSARDTVRDLR